MPMFRFQVQDAPRTPVETNDGHEYAAKRVSPSSPSSPSTQSSSSESSGNGRWNNRRRRRGTPRNVEKRPYHSPTHVSPPHDKPMTKNDIYFALDCEMVGVGPEGLESAVARVTVCNWDEDVILDKFVKVPVEVTDYRTFVSGIEAKDLESDDAVSLTDVRKMVKEILHGKILIGHALENDLAALQITHPWHDIRDSASYPPFMKEADTSASGAKAGLRPRKLKELVKDKLGRDIQSLGVAHDPIEDARAAMGLYKSDRMAWEKLVMQQVASARKKEGREAEPSGRDSPYSASGGYAQPKAMPTMPNMSNRMQPIQQKNVSYSYAHSHHHSMYFNRSRSAPTSTVMTGHHVGPYGHQAQAYYPQQHYLY